MLGAVCLLALPMLWVLGPIRSAIPATKLALDAKKASDSTL
jgi:hypothetical protein